jgi:hypothetical protein
MIKYKCVRHLIPILMINKVKKEKNIYLLSLSKIVIKWNYSKKINFPNRFFIKKIKGFYRIFLKMKENIFKLI